MLIAKPSVTVPPTLGEQDELKLFVRGFDQTERRLLDAIVKISQRRKPPIALLQENEAKHADVVMIDATDRQAMDWSAQQKWLRDKPVAWVDAASAVPPGHTLVKRPVQWPILPMLLSRVLYAKSAAATTPSALEKTTVAPGEKSAAQPSAKSTKLSVGARVLVADDSLAVREYLRSQLDPHGLIITYAETGEAALAATQGGNFTCVLLDVLMPGIDGYETCRRIKAQYRTGFGPAIIMLTSRTSPFDRIRGKMAGCDAYLTKPVEPSQLQETLLRFIPAAKRG